MGFWDGVMGFEMFIDDSCFDLCGLDEVGKGATDPLLVTKTGGGKMYIIVLGI